jgi:dolichol-phosphate mannosyltransferase
MADLSIILPTLNERENIVPMVESLLQVMDRLGEGLEVIVVDDNSPDGTAGAVNTTFSNDRRVRVIVRAENPGLAHSIREGIERSVGKVILVMDTDFNHPPEYVPMLYDFTRHADLVVGSRFIFGGGMPNKLHYYLSYIFNLFMRVLAGTRIDDNLSGFFSIRREGLMRLDFDTVFWGYGDYFFRLLLRSQGLGLYHVEVPVMYGERRSGQRKTRFLRVAMKYTKEVFRVAFLKAIGRW